MKFIFIRAKKDVISEKNDEMKNLKKEIKCKEMTFWRGSNEFVYLQKKSNQRKNIEKNICMFITCKNDLIKFSCCYTQDFARNRIFIENITFSILIHYN